MFGVDLNECLAGKNEIQWDIDEVLDAVGRGEEWQVERVAGQVGPVMLYT